MKKKIGKSVTLYIPEHLMAKAKVVADERERSTSFIVACALKQYLNPEESIYGHSDVSND